MLEDTREACHSRGALNAYHRNRREHLGVLGLQLRVVILLIRALAQAEEELPRGAEVYRQQRGCCWLT